MLLLKEDCKHFLGQRNLALLRGELFFWTTKDAKSICSRLQFWICLIQINRYNCSLDSQVLRKDNLATRYTIRCWSVLPILLEIASFTPHWTGLGRANNRLLNYPFRFGLDLVVIDWAKPPSVAGRSLSRAKPRDQDFAIEERPKTAWRWDGESVSYFFARPWVSRFNLRTVDTLQ